MIFKCFWYNKDHYGPKNGISVLLQADSETDATQKAISHIQKVYPCAGKGYDFDQYSHYECKDMTDQEILRLQHINGGIYG